MLNNLMSALANLESGDNYRQAMSQPMQRMLEDLYHEIKGRSPKGYPPGGGRPNDPYGVPPSVRTGHSMISESWVRQIEMSDNPIGLSLQLLNFSEHVLAVVSGTPPHRIPKTGETKLVFFWGDAIKPGRGWGPKGNPKHLENPKEGIRRFKWVDHPGIREPNPFIKTMAKDQKDRVGKEIGAAVGNYIRSTMISAGLEEVSG